MERWHESSCATPSVFAGGDTLRCRSCNIAAPDSHRLPAQQDNAFSPLAIPRDEGEGQMNLWWPPSVPYSPKSQVEEQVAKDSGFSTTPAGLKINTGYIVKNRPPLELAALKFSETPLHEGETKSLPIYSSVLAADELRLLHLHAANDSDSPIHADLEVYRDGNCPEYEAVSYTWGGEDGDSRPCLPVYVNSYWDMILQTTNCWNMLRQLRPRNGTRIVWVDAICINQSSAEERGQQVAKMGTIYRNCLRVVVYLGPDIVIADSPNHRHPSRHGLHEFAQVMNGKAAAEGIIIKELQELFTRRYFSRVWVIQELVLARNVVIPVGYTEFWATNLTPKYLAASSGPFDWNSTAAPWIQFIGRTFIDDHDLYRILRHAWSCKASDPRDRVFGILGLLQSNPARSAPAAPDASPRHNELLPSYHISAQHVFIGFSAHLVINLGVADVLMSASGLEARPGCPSWVPDWQGEWNLSGEDQIDKTYTTGIQSPISRLHALRKPGPYSRGLVILSPLSLWPLLKDGSHPEAMWSNAKLEQRPPESWRKRREADPKLYDVNSWCRGASVDPSTGALSTRLHHLVGFNTAPMLTEVADLYEIGQEMCAMFIMTQKGGPSLNTLIPPGRNQLFYLEKEYGDPGYLLVFLQELNSHSKSSEKSFKLMVCCAYADIFFMCPLPGLHIYRPFEVDLQTSLHQVISQALRKIGDKKVLFGSLSDALKDYPGDERGKRSLCQLFPCRHIPLGDVLDVLQGCLDEFQGQKHTFESYVQCVRKRIPRLQCHVRVADDQNRGRGWIELTLTPEDWAEYKESYRTLGPHEIDWEWCYVPSSAVGWWGKDWKYCRVDKYWGPWKPGRAVSVRATFNDIISNIQAITFYRALSIIRFGRRRTHDIGAANTGEDEVTVLKRGPQFSDHLVPIRRWPSSLVESFAADGIPWQVRIV